MNHSVFDVKQAGNKSYEMCYAKVTRDVLYLTSYELNILHPWSEIKDAVKNAGKR